MDYPSFTYFARVLKSFRHWATDEPPPPGKYAIWWPDGILSFHDSDAREYMGRAYRALDGIESRVFAAILHSLGALEETVPAVSLPEDLFSVYLFTNDHQPFFFSASQEKGLRFHFHVELADRDWRDWFFMIFADYAEAWRRRQREEADFAEDALEDGSRPLDWWLLTEEAIDVAVSTGFSPEVVGAIVI